MIKKLKRIIFYFLLSIISFLLLIQIPSLNTRLTQSLINAALPEGMRVEISPISGEFPFWFMIDSVKISDTNGLWLRIEKFDFSWVAADILFGKLTIDKVGAESIEISRLPVIKSGKGGSKASFPAVIEDYYINQFKVTPWYSGSVKVHGDLLLTKQENIDARLYLETIDQIEHGDADLLELKITKDSKSIKIFSEAKDSLTRLKTIAPELINKIKDGDYELNIDLEVNLDGTNVNGILSGAINNFESIDASFDKIIGNNLDFYIKVHKVESEETIVGTGEFTSANNIKMEWDLDYSLLTKDYKSHLNLFVSKVNQLVSPVFRGDLNAAITVAGMMGTWHELKWKISGLQIRGQDIKELMGNISYREYLGDVFIQLESSRLNSTVKSNFTLQDGILSFTELSIKGNDHEIKGDLSLHFMNMGVETANLNIMLGDVSSFSSFLGYSLVGSVKGSYKQNLDQLLLNLTCKEFSFNNLDFESVVAKVDYSNLKNFTMSLSAQRGYLNNNKINSLEFFSECKKGKGEFSHNLTGPVTELVANGAINTVDGKTLKILLKKANFTHDQKKYLSLTKPLMIEVLPGHLKIFSNRLNVDDGSVQFSDFSIGESYQGKLSFNGIPGKIFSILTDDLDFIGEINGELQMGGTNKKPSILGKMHLINFGVMDSARKTQKIINSSWDFKFINNRWLINCDFRDSENSKLLIQTSIDTPYLIPDHTAKVTTTVKGKVYLSIYNSFIWWGDRIKGTLMLDFTSTLSPQVCYNKGFISLKDGEYENAEFGTILRQIDLAVNLNGSQLRIARLTAKDVNEGTVSGHGEIDLGHFNRFRPNFEVTFNDFLLVNNDIISAHGMGHISVKPTVNNEFIVSGDVKAKYIDVFLDDTVSSVKNIILTEVIKNSQYKKKYYKNKKKASAKSTYDLKIHIPEKLYVQGRGIKSMWHGDLTVMGPLNNPYIGGELLIKKGEVELIGKKMEVHKGSKIWFVNKGDEITPAIGITLVKMVQDTKAMIKVSGLVTDPKIEFASMPHLSQEEVVSLILFGKPLSSVSSAQSLQLATALASIKAGNNKLNILDQFQQAFGLDELTFQNIATEGDDSNTNNFSNYAVRIGKQLNEKIYFGIDQGLGEEGKTKAIVDIDVTKNTKVGIEVGPEETSIGYIWEKRY